MAGAWTGGGKPISADFSPVSIRDFSGANVRNTEKYIRQDLNMRRFFGKALRTNRVFRTGADWVSTWGNHSGE
jgi:hypothetical protein